VPVERRTRPRASPSRATARRAAPPPSPTDEDLFGQTIKDVYFDYDKSDIRGDQSASIQADMLFLNQHPGINFTVEGHCDDPAAPPSTTWLWATSAPVP
jgi:outer membrane protein OmpA-like peptidoglycan-associated protein